MMASGDAINIEFMKIEPDAKLPEHHSEGAVGADVYAFAVDRDGRPNTIILSPNSTRQIRTGLRIRCAAPVLVFSRSGLAAHSIFVANSPGLIDPDYRGELFILLYNGGHQSHYIKHHDRIAQLTMFESVRFSVVPVDHISYDETERGEGGFGSTGR